MIFYPEERIAIFIDGANLYSAARGLASTSTTDGCSNCFARRGG